MELYLYCLLGILLVGLHHAARRMFYRLPLHQESGFYVSNDTILNRRFNPRKSWHARFSGGNKLVPEFFFSFVYLCSGGKKYAYYSRFAYTIFSILLLPPMAIICFELGMGQLEIWLAMFLLALVLAEPQFGSYYESGEQFELFALLWGMAMVMTGIENALPLWVGVGIGLWLLSAFFIKFSFIITPFVFSIQLLKANEPWAAIILPWIAAITLYVLWLMFLQSQPLRPIMNLARHKLMGGHRLFSKQGMLLLYAKFQQILDVFGQNLPILLIAAYGFFSASSSGDEQGYHYIFVLTMCTLISFFLQGNPASYQCLPMVPALVIWATHGVFVLRHGPINFWTALSWLALAFYYLVFFLRPRLMSPAEFYRWVWSSRPRNLPESEVLKDSALLADIQRIKSKTFDFSVFLAGPHTQLQVLLQAAYPTTLVGAAPWLDELEPDWQNEIVASFRVYPAPYILDTADCFSLAQAIRWGFDYQMLDENPGLWRLYGHQPAKIQWKGQEGTPRIFDFTAYTARQD
jgi:hypothetical protein